uniref:Uncharacterized protein n=1 Tax=Panagrolaimus superbus TaxID=310955 RepID=A0A914YRD8_9BILA
MEDNEAESSHVFDDKENLSPEKIFADILKSCEEYTTEKVEVLMLNKSKILSLLKTHRPLKMVDYFYGLTGNLLKNRCLIVFEWDDKRMVRHYYKHFTKHMWRCIKCKQLYNHNLVSTCSYLFMVNGIVFVPNNHECRPRDYEIVMQYQKFLEEGNPQLARSMVHTVNFDFGESSHAYVVI